MKLLRIIIATAGLALVLGTVNLSIREKQEVLANGQRVLLELRPVDPRSLMQGDYMRLSYGETSAPGAEITDQMPPQGTVILKLDENEVATFSRIDDGTALQEGEIRMQYKLRLERGFVRYGAESFFFQEGHAKLYEEAKYGVLRVDEEGASVLVGLAGEDRKLIEKPKD